MKQVLYVSDAASLMRDNDLKNMLSEARKNNLEHEITGVLFYISGKFIQCIEGKEKKVDQLVSNIKEDKRNTSLVVLSQSEIATRSFPNWSMGFRTYSVEEFSNEDGFFRLDDEGFLKDLETRHEELIKIMLAFYND